MPTSTVPSISIDPAIILWFFFILVMLVTAYFVFAHLYHWIRYASLYPLVWIALPVYLAGVFILVSIMLGAIAIS